ncbi:molybdate ABC transporter substrate-binding protein [Tepidimonas charontis]|nr:molybdate ABC transporter substrate-binding protein [Tepidimonas charontis]
MSIGPAAVTISRVRRLPSTVSLSVQYVTASPSMLALTDARAPGAHHRLAPPPWRRHLGLRRRHWLAWAASTALGSALSLARAQSGNSTTVVAASDLKFALSEIAALFERKHGQRVRLIFGSSGQFTAQILQGAPFHVFLSADEAFVYRLADAGLTVDRGQRYAIGRIGLFVPHGSPLKADGTLRDLAAALQDGRLKKFAIASPEHAPYGMRAREALQHAGLWAAIQPHLVLGENIAQTVQFASSGGTQGGIIAYALALAPEVAARGHFALIDATWHQPLAQRMVLLRGAPPSAQAFYAFLSTPEVRAVLQRYGFELPSPAS